MNCSRSQKKPNLWTRLFGKLKKKPSNGKFDSQTKCAETTIKNSTEKKYNKGSEKLKKQPKTVQTTDKFESLRFRTIKLSLKPYLNKKNKNRDTNNKIDEDSNENFKIEKSYDPNDKNINNLHDNAKSKNDVLETKTLSSHSNSIKVSSIKGKRFVNESENSHKDSNVLITDRDIENYEGKRYDDEKNIDTIVETLVQPKYSTESERKLNSELIESIPKSKITELCRRERKFKLKDHQMQNPSTKYSKYLNSNTSKLNKNPKKRCKKFQRTNSNAKEDEVSLRKAIEMSSELTLKLKLLNNKENNKSKLKKDRKKYLTSNATGHINDSKLSVYSIKNDRSFDFKRNNDKIQP